MFKKTNTHSNLWNKIAGNWKQFSGEIRKHWGLLTDNDMEEIQGDRDILLGKLQERYGYAQDHAERKLAEFESTLNS